MRQTRARVLHAEPALGPGENALLSAEGADAATQIAPSAEGAEAATQIAPSAEGAEAATQIAPSAEGAEAATQIAPSAEGAEYESQGQARSASPLGRHHNHPEALKERNNWR